MDYLSDYLIAISFGFVSGLLLGAISIALKVIRGSFRQVLNVADY